MNSGTDKQIEPVCKFGPGGDFVFIWPESSQLQPPSWKSQCAFKGIATKKHARRLSVVSKVSSFSVNQPMLFPDEDRISPKAVYKPRLRTWTRRGNTKKRLRVDVAERNLPFTSDVRIARTA